MQPAKPLGQRLLAYALCASLACPLPGRAANENRTDIADVPVTQPATLSMKPNILLILDDSGSMARQYTPDYVSTYLIPSGTIVTKNCFDSFDANTTNGAGSAGVINNTPDECWAGDPPAMTPDFNVQYYNPEIRYRPAVDYNGIERDSMTCLKTGGVAITGITVGATTLLTVANTVAVNSIQSFVGFAGADKDLLNNKSFTVTARDATTMTINANTTGKAITVTGGAPCTFGWTATKTDNVSASGSDYARKDLTSSAGGPTSASGNWSNDASPMITTLNLTTQWPERVWCKTVADSATDTALCKTNSSSYAYPNAVFAYGLDASNARKYRFGAPYYYRIVPKEYCVDARMDDCLPLCEGGASPPGCIVSATAPDNVVGGKSYSVMARVRFCTDSSLTSCQAKRSSSRLYPKFLGTVAAPVVAVRPATATIYLADVAGASQPDAANGNLTSLVVTRHFENPDGTITDADFILIPSPGITLTGGSSNSTWANQIETAIMATSGTTGFTATSPGSTVVITAPGGGTASPNLPEDFNGATIAITTTPGTPTAASFTWAFTSTVQNSACTTSGAPPVLSCGNVSSMIVNGVNLIPDANNPIKCNVANCNAGGSTGQDTRNTAMRDRVLANISLTGLGAGWTATAVTVSGKANGLKITAPASLGSSANTLTVSMARAKTTAATSGTLSGGITVGDIVHEKTTFGNAHNAPAAGDLVRNNLGTFDRVNIVPGAVYNKSSERSDCLALPSNCTFEEEMTNFANWFSYYRTRIQTAKSAIGRAFALAGITSNFRVGFVTINFSSTRYLAVAPFVDGATAQRGLWFDELYASPASGSTPLIGALARAGRYFADRFNGGGSTTMGSSPINSACQPNYTILTSDGYWNDGSNPAKKEDGSTNIGDADGDGHPNTLADTAHYYYNTDLRPIPAVSPSTVGYKNQVAPSGEDTAPHQHMTTFTVGMGVSGSLLFHPSYQTPGNSIDYDTIVGTPAAPGNNAWPQPVANTETTIDDMWHAAVNAKGRFFSAQNPVALAAGINEVLAAVQKRVGAGAAAATSNLQPVAGDNFAFTAQYQTVEWSGDVKARTISLVDGVIGATELWSAQTQLDFRTFGDRVIYTYDAADTDPLATVAGLDGDTIAQNANRLRSFCRPGAGAATYPTCTDGGLITDAERIAYFNPLGGPNGALTHAAGWPAGDDRKVNAASTNNTYLFRYLRGERAREITLGGTSGTDMYRARTHILGDVVNAQPAYVKASPFSYGASTDPFYTAFQNTTNGTVATRQGTVYVAANDGMLHAFETDPDSIPYYQSAGVSSLDDSTDDEFVGTLNSDPVTGEGAERWAYVPQLIFPTMKFLAEDPYTHRYYTDGSPQIGDVCFDHSTSTPCSAANKWRTILVAGLNNGGRGFYALDVTDPLNPKGLWEVAGGDEAKVSGSVKCLSTAEANSGTFNVDCNIGYSFGNPIIAKRAEDGKWVVLFTSGYNNYAPGSGVGYLYMVDAKTGMILRRMSTGVGCSVADIAPPDDALTCSANIDDPSGLSRINAWVDNATTDNTAKAVYGGDLKGNLWRFQLDDTASVPRYSVTRLATVEGDSSSLQPITARPELATVGGQRVIYIGTGKFLGDGDKSSLTRQSIYAIKDTMAGVSDPQIDMARTVPGAIAGFVKQTLSEDSTSTRTVATPQTVDLGGTDKGWFIDLPDGGTGEEAAERVSVDPIIQLGTLVVASNVPSTETCLAGGSGWVNFLDIKSGAPITGTIANPASVKVSGSLIVGINIVKIGDQIKAIVTTADNQQLTKETPVAATGVTGRRVSWRELVVE